MAVSFNVDIVRRAFDEQEAAKRKAARASSRTTAYDEVDLYPWRYVKEQWTDFLIVQGEGRTSALTKIPYTVDDKQNVSFGEESDIKVEYVPLSGTETETALLWSTPYGHSTNVLIQKVKSV